VCPFLMQLERVLQFGRCNGLCVGDGERGGEGG